MPVKDGYQATQEILKMVEKEQSRLGLARNNSADGVDQDFCSIVALTSYTTSEVEERCLKLGMKRVIFKPINSTQLKEIIDKYLFSESKSLNLQN